MSLVLRLLVTSWCPILVLMVAPLNPILPWRVLSWRLLTPGLLGRGLLSKGLLLLPVKAS